MRSFALPSLATIFLTGCPAITQADIDARIDQDRDGYISVQFEGDDCDDANADVRPGAPDAPYDDVDADCSGGSDNDADGDGYDDLAHGGDDCNDTAPAANPGGVEGCDGLDNDCDGVTGDPSDPSTDESDGDGDGYFVCADDCDDTNASIHPGGAEICDPDNADEDCDGSTDDGDNGATGQTEWYLDSDHDGYGTPDSVASVCDAPADYVDNALDCDDHDDAISPETLWYADVDEDGWGNDTDSIAQCTQPEGYVDELGDCVDTDPAIHPEATESCNAIDDDCDGDVDADDPGVDPVEALWYRDRDGDGYGDATAPITACSAGAGYVHNAEDCDDFRSSTHPYAAEVCDTDDNDCDAYVDDEDPDVTDMPTWYADDDGDGFGVPEWSQVACFEPSGYVEDATDCDDSDSGDYPGAVETVGNGDDEDCTGGEICYVDNDDDGYLDRTGDTVGSTDPDCADAYEGTSVDPASDCDDGDATARVGCADYATVWGSEMIAIPAGSFSMGSGLGDPDSDYVDHTVTLTHDFWIGQTEVTRAQWESWSGGVGWAYMSFACTGAAADCPTSMVSWYDVAKYANALSTYEGLTSCYLTDGTDLEAAYRADPYSCPGYRLPTEAEWEYAARAGEDMTYSGSNTAADVAWTYETAYFIGTYSHEVAMLAPNAWGLYDMSGNQWEWTNDWLDWSYDGYGTGSAITDPPGPTSGEGRVGRGGDWYYLADRAPVAHRGYFSEASAIPWVGFRLCRSIP